MKTEHTSQQANKEKKKKKGGETKTAVSHISVVLAGP